MKKVILSCGLLIMSFTPSYALDKGQTQVSYKGEVKADRGDQDIDHKFKISYGVTDRLALSLEGRLRNQDGREDEYNRTKFELDYLFSQPEDYMQKTLELKYEYNHSGSNDKIGATLILGKKYGKWKHAIEPELYHEVGEDKTSGLAGKLEMQTAYSFDKFSLGYAYEGDFGRFKDHLNYSDQDHAVGPKVGFNIPVGGQKIGLSFIYKTAISRAAADHEFIYQIKTKF